MCMLYKRPYLFSYLLSELGNCRRPLSISLCPTRRAPISSYWMLTMSTPAPVAADPQFGPQPSLMMVLAQRPGRNWQAKLAGICWGSAGLWLWRARLPTAIYYWTQVVSFPPHFSPPPKNSILQAECRLNQSWHAQCPWVDWRSYCRCVCVCGLLWHSEGSERCILYYKQQHKRIQQHMSLCKPCKVSWLGQESSKLNNNKKVIM